MSWLHAYAGLVLLATLALVFAFVARREIRAWWVGVEADVSTYRDMNRSSR